MVKFNFTNPGTEDCLNIKVNWQPLEGEFTGELRVDGGSSLYISCKKEWKITGFKVNGQNVSWSGSKYLAINEDTTIDVTAVENDKESCTLNIDNADAIDFYIEGKKVEGLVNGDNTLNFYPNSSAYFMPKTGYEVTSLKIGSWGYAFEAEGQTDISSLNDGDVITITTRAK